MIAAELRGDNRPSLNEALGWIGSRIDDIYGAQIGRLEDVWIDPGTGEPRWLLVKEGRFGGRATLIPFADATAGAGHVWIPYEADVVRDAPQIEPGAPLTQQVEIALRRHYAANSPAAFERAEQLGTSVEPPAHAEEPGADPAGSPEGPPQSGPIPDRPAPPVAAPEAERGERRSSFEGEEGRRAAGSETEAGERGGEEAAGAGRGEAPPRAATPGDPGPPPAPGYGPPPWAPPPGPYGWPFGPGAGPAYPPLPGYPPAYASYPPYPYYGGYPAAMPAAPPPAPGYAAAPADPLSAFAGREVEIELEGPVTIRGTVRSVRFAGEPGESSGSDR